MLEYIFNIFITLLIIFPLTIFIHELGHAFFLKIFKIPFNKIILGIGKELFSINKIQINTYYFLGGGCDYSLTNRVHWFKYFLFSFGGILFNIISVCLVYYFSKDILFHSDSFLSNISLLFILISSVSILNILPLRFTIFGKKMTFDGYNMFVQPQNKALK
ncbi:hypothetical protein [Lysinibacillus telephonicus]|uniref:Peptidase M50 domain-containing protein n=1 Tax=Lysinibacillus telephonicus TaxID=1714840 RepID=A0A431US50_9BACI|nr:hypothetical protein [Lysinibacillus telephonicus]RTQ92261.1 hypothetical protein EKG35_12295 [Lysinibacillus telephonicus]